MRIVLNLASQPFVELRPLYARLRMWMLALVVLAIPLGLLLRMEQRRAADADARMATLQTSIQNMRDQQAGFRNLMQQPQNAAVLSQSDFLNQLFIRKSFSWTAVMMDLEDVLPSGVQVLNIDPIPRPDGHVTIRMRVAGPRNRAVDLVRNLEGSRRFLLPRLASEAAEATSGGQSSALPNGMPTVEPVSAESGVNFDVLADYNPLPNVAMIVAQSGTEPPAPAHAASKLHAKPVAKTTKAHGTPVPAQGGVQ
jgi:type IV pilus assembly protein PilN